jgi:hypothetical protein
MPATYAIIHPTGISSCIHKLGLTFCGLAKPHSDLSSLTTYIVFSVHRRYIQDQSRLKDSQLKKNFIPKGVRISKYQILKGQQIFTILVLIRKAGAHFCSCLRKKLLKALLRTEDGLAIFHHRKPGTCA